MKKTIRDVARLANVSIATASMALNNKKGVSAATKNRVLLAAKQLNYVPNHSARSLVTRDSKCIGLLVPEIVNPFYSAIVDHMTILAEEMGYMLLLGISNNKSKQEKVFVEALASWRAQGVIIVPMLQANPDTDHLSILAAEKIPVVFCTDYYDEWSNGERAAYPCVMCDLEYGEYKMIEYLIKQGHREICFLNVNTDAHFAKLRQKGYEKAFKKHKLMINPDNMFYANETNFGAAYELTDEMLARNPDAIACINDMMTLGILKRLFERKIDIPKDMAVAGFDDMLFTELAQKPISTVRQPLLKICERTIKLLDRTIKKGEVEKQNNIILEKPELIIRSTT